MKLKYIKQIEGSTVSYGQTVRTGDVIGSVVFAPIEQTMIAKALRTGDWIEAQEEIEATEQGVVFEKPKQTRKRK